MQIDSTCGDSFPIQDTGEHTWLTNMNWAKQYAKYCVHEGYFRKQRSVINLERYFPLHSKESFLMLMIKLQRLFGPRFPSLDQKLLPWKLEMKFLEEEAEELECRLHKRKAFCFTKRWRKMHQIIFVTVRTFSGADGNDRIRACICDQSGLAMHCITGVALEEHAEVLTRYVLKNYRVLKRIVLVYLSNTPDIRLYYQLSEAASFQLKDIILVCSQNLHANTSLDLSQQAEQVGRRSAISTIAIGSCQFNIFGGEMPQKQARIISDNIYKLLTKEIWLSTSIFKDIPCNEARMNLSSFLLCLYMYYFNFASEFNVADQGLDQTALHRRIQINIYDGMMRFIRRTNQPSLQLHLIKQIQIARPCAVCAKGKPKYSCVLCCNEFKKDFGLCPHDCFKRFHLQTTDYFSKIKTDMHKSPKTQLTSIDIAKLVETDLADEINDCEAVHSFLSKIYSSRANSTMVLRLWKGFIQEEERAAEVYSRNTQDGLICSALHDSFEDDESEMAPTDE